MEAKNMGYEDAKATRIMARRCFACGRDLIDSVSVDVGMGPVCRKRHGYGEIADLTDPASRKLANKLVYEASAMFETNPARVIEISDEIHDLGLYTLATIMRERFIRIRLEVVTGADLYGWDRERRCEIPGGTGDIVQLHSPYHPDFSRLLKQSFRGLYRRPVYGETASHYTVSHWEIERKDSRVLLSVLAQCWPGEVAWGSEKGTFTVPTKAAFDAAFRKGC